VFAFLHLCFTQWWPAACPRGKRSSQGVAFYPCFTQWWPAACPRGKRSSHGVAFTYLPCGASRSGGQQPIHEVGGLRMVLPSRTYCFWCFTQWWPVACPRGRRSLHCAAFAYLHIQSGSCAGVPWAKASQLHCCGASACFAGVPQGRPFPAPGLTVGVNSATGLL